MQLKDPSYFGTTTLIKTNLIISKSCERLSHVNSQLRDKDIPWHHRSFLIEIVSLISTFSSNGYCSEDIIYFHQLVP